jgi:hypothetical protein
MIMVRQPGFRILPVVLAAVVMFAVVGSLVHLVCENKGGSGSPAEAVGLGLCVLSVAFGASKTRRALRTLLWVRVVLIEPPWHSKLCSCGSFTACRPRPHPHFLSFRSGAHDVRPAG